MRETSKSIVAIDTQIESLWGDVRRLMATAAEKTKHIELLIHNGQTPIYTGDAPAATWEAINQHFRAIGELRRLRVDLLRPSSKIEAAGHHRDRHPRAGPRDRPRAVGVR